MTEKGAEVPETWSKERKVKKFQKRDKNSNTPALLYLCKRDGDQVRRITNAEFENEFKDKFPEYYEGFTTDDFVNKTKDYIKLMDLPENIPVFGHWK